MVNLNLIEMLPPSTKRMKEEEEIQRVLSMELNGISAKQNQIQKNANIVSCDEYGIGVKESDMMMTPVEGSSLEQRKVRCIIKWNDSLPYNWANLMGLLDQVIGVSKYSAILNDSTITLSYQEAVISPQELYDVIRDWIPTKIDLHTYIDSPLRLKKEEKIYKFYEPLCGTIPYVSEIGTIDRFVLKLKKSSMARRESYPQAETTTGKEPYTSELGTVGRADITFNNSNISHTVDYPQGEIETGSEPYIAEKGTIGGQNLRLGNVESDGAINNSETGTIPYTSEIATTEQTTINHAKTVSEASFTPPLTGDNTMLTS